MSLTSKKIDELRAYAKDRKGEIAKLVSDAADTIELLSAKLSAANRMDDYISRKAEIERIDRIFRDLNMACAYDMPSFRCNKGKDYAVIPTKYHKGYQKALEDAEKRIMDALKEMMP